MASAKKKGSSHEGQVGVSRKKKAEQTTWKPSYEPPVFENLVITRNGGPESDGGIALAEWLDAVAADPTMIHDPYWYGTDPVTHNQHKVRAVGGARLVRGYLDQRFYWHRSRIVGWACNEAMVGKAQDLAKVLEAKCVPVGEGPQLRYEDGESIITLDRSKVDLGFKISSAMWLPIEQLIAAMEEDNWNAVYLFNEAGIMVGSMSAPIGFVLGYLSSGLYHPITVTGGWKGPPFPNVLDWQFVIDLESGSLQPLCRSY